MPAPEDANPAPQGPDAPPADANPDGGLAFVNRWIAVAIYMVVAVMWLVPDCRLERRYSAV